MSKSKEISFYAINADRTTPIDGERLAASKARIREEMKGDVQEFKRKETLSIRAAAKQVLNA